MPAFEIYVPSFTLVIKCAQNKEEANQAAEPLISQWAKNNRLDAVMLSSLDAIERACDNADRVLE